MKFNFTRMIPGAVLLCLALASCKKNDAVSPSTQLSSELTNATNVIVLGEDELNAEIDELLSSDDGTESISNGSFDCKTVSYAPSKKVYPHVKTADFGSGCSNGEGKTVSGKKMLTVYADPKTAAPGTLISETNFSNYVINGLTVEGWTKKTLISAGKYKIVTRKTFRDHAGSTSSFRGTHFEKQIEGNTTETHKDDVYEITGSSTGGEKIKGNTVALWEATIDKNNVVIKSAGCSFRSKGGLQIQVQQIGSATDNEYLDYGNGTCDNMATLSVNGGTPVDVTLPLVFYTAHL